MKTPKPEREPRIPLVEKANPLAGHGVFTSTQRASLRFPRGHVEIICGNAKGNHAARRVLSLFIAKSGGKLEASPAFAAQWNAFVTARRADAEDLAWRLVKVANRPLGVRCQPSHVTVNHLTYCPQDFPRACRSD